MLLCVDRADDLRVEPLVGQRRAAAVPGSAYRRHSKLNCPSSRFNRARKSATCRSRLANPAPENRPHRKPTLGASATCGRPGCIAGRLVEPSPAVRAAVKVCV
jgi:hypothetical protein